MPGLKRRRHYFNFALEDFCRSVNQWVAANQNAIKKNAYSCADDLVKIWTCLYNCCEPERYIRPEQAQYVRAPQEMSDNQLAANLKQALIAIKNILKEIKTPWFSNSNALRDVVQGRVQFIEATLQADATRIADLHDAIRNNTWNAEFISYQSLDVNVIPDMIIARGRENKNALHVAAEVSKDVVIRLLSILRTDEARRVALTTVNSRGQNVIAASKNPAETRALIISNFPELKLPAVTYETAHAITRVSATHSTFEVIERDQYAAYAAPAPDC